VSQQKQQGPDVVLLYFEGCGGRRCVCSAARRSGQTVQLGVGCTAAEKQFELWYSCGEERVQVGLVELLNSVVDSVSSTEPSRSLFLLK
jgi:hypothetical protein